jgi:hypothetical protein
VADRREVLEQLASMRNGMQDLAALAPRLANTVARVREMQVCAVDIQEAELAPEFMVPKPLKEAFKAGRAAAGAFVFKDPGMQRTADAFASSVTQYAAKAASRKAAGYVKDPRPTAKPRPMGSTSTPPARQAGKDGK